jgi:hypothetical protein
MNGYYVDLSTHVTLLLENVLPPCTHFCPANSLTRVAMATMCASSSFFLFMMASALSPPPPSPSLAALLCCRAVRYLLGLECGGEYYYVMMIGRGGEWWLDVMLCRVRECKQAAIDG